MTSNLLYTRKCFTFLAVMAAIAIFILAGCSNTTDNMPVQTVDWYKSHDTERKAMITQCKNNPGELEATPNCINSTRAQTSLDNARRGWPKLNSK